MPGAFGDRGFDEELKVGGESVPPRFASEYRTTQGISDPSHATNRRECDQTESATYLAHAGSSGGVQR